MSTWTRLGLLSLFSLPALWQVGSAMLDPGESPGPPKPRVSPDRAAEWESEERRAKATSLDLARLLAANLFGEGETTAPPRSRRPPGSALLEEIARSRQAGFIARLIVAEEIGPVRDKVEALRVLLDEVESSVDSDRISPMIKDRLREWSGKASTGSSSP